MGGGGGACDRLPLKTKIHYIHTHIFPLYEVCGSPKIGKGGPPGSTPEIYNILTMFSVGLTVSETIMI